MFIKEALFRCQIESRLTVEGKRYPVKPECTHKLFDSLSLSLSLSLRLTQQAGEKKKISYNFSYTAHKWCTPVDAFTWSTPLMSSSLLLQQCPTCLVRLILILFVMGGRWLYSYCFVWCCLQDLFNTARSVI